MDLPPCPKVETKGNLNISESLNIIQENKSYILTINIEENTITFIIKEDKSLINIYYNKTMYLDDIKQLHKAFYGLNSCDEFFDYIKKLIENKNLFIKENEENLTINFEVIYLFQKSIVEISLNQQKINNENIVNNIITELLLIKEQINNMENNQKDKNIESNDKEEINNLKEEINKLKEEIIDLKKIKDDNKKMIDNIQNLNEEIKGMKDLSEKNKKLEDEINMLKNEIKKNEIIYDKDKNNIIKFEEENKLLKEDNENMKLKINKLNNNIEPIKNIIDAIYNKSNLINRTDFDFLKKEIEKKMNQKVKNIKKLYQATLDGGDSSIFHLKCDNISNTLTIICSEKGRIFGGFTTETWDISGKFKDDRNSFLFSLDKYKIYSYKCNGKAIYCHKDFGPTFGSGFTIKIGKNAIIDKLLYTYEYYPDGCSFNFNKDLYALSESGKGKASYIYAMEYEVYKIEYEDISSP